MSRVRLKMKMKRLEKCLQRRGMGEAGAVSDDKYLRGIIFVLDIGWGGELLYIILIQ